MLTTWEQRSLLFLQKFRRLSCQHAAYSKQWLCMRYQSFAESVKARMSQERVPVLKGQLKLTPDGLQITDSTGRNGALLDTQLVVFARWKFDDAHQLGAFHLRLEPEVIPPSTGRVPQSSVEDSPSSENARWTEIIDTLKSGGFGR